MQGSKPRSLRLQMTRQHGFILIWILVFALFMALIMVSGLRNSWLQERIQGNTVFQQATFQAAESGLVWWLDHVQQRLQSEGITGLQRDGWMAQSIVACATRRQVLPGPCGDTVSHRFHAAELPLFVELETRYIAAQDALASSVQPLRYYHFQTQATSYLAQQGKRQFVARHVQHWRWLDQIPAQITQGP